MLFNCCPDLDQVNIKLYYAVQINVVKGCASVVFVHTTYEHVYLDNRVRLNPRNHV